MLKLTSVNVYWSVCIGQLFDLIGCRVPLTHPACASRLHCFVLLGQLLSKLWTQHVSQASPADITFRSFDSKLIIWTHCPFILNWWRCQDNVCDSRRMFSYSLPIHITRYLCRLWQIGCNCGSSRLCTTERYRRQGSIHWPVESPRFCFFSQSFARLLISFMSCLSFSIFEIFAAFMFTGLLTSFLVPETKGKTLEELCEILYLLYALFDLNRNTNGRQYTHEFIPCLSVAGEDQTNFVRDHSSEEAIRNDSSAS